MIRRLQCNVNESSGLEVSGRVSSSKPSSSSVKNNLSLSYALIMSDVPALPHHVLKVILQLVPIKDRLTSCCLVSKAFHTAATAATTSLSIREWKLHRLLTPWNLPRQPASPDAVLGWLDRHGTGLSSLQLEFGHLSRLPCQHLQHLQLSTFHVQVCCHSDMSTCTWQLRPAWRRMLQCDRQQTAA